MVRVVARAPAKVILSGEHAVNRGHRAIAAAVDVITRCTVQVRTSRNYRFEGGGREAVYPKDEIASLRAILSNCLTCKNYDHLLEILRQHYFAPSLYIVGSVLNDDMPDGLDITFETSASVSSGMGSGASCFVSLSLALATLMREERREVIGRWAYLGECVAHGGIASGLDTQTILHGGIIAHSETDGNEQLTCPRDLRAVVGDTMEPARTSSINRQVQAWLQAIPTRAVYFDAIGDISEMVTAAIRAGEVSKLGRLMVMNQLLLERIGVSSPSLNRLVEAALGAGAEGAKLSGSGGGGIMVALVKAECEEAVARAIESAGGKSYRLALGAPGARIEEICT
jgi:mevalonate kinase